MKNLAQVLQDSTIEINPKYGGVKTAIKGIVMDNVPEGMSTVSSGWAYDENDWIFKWVKVN